MFIITACHAPSCWVKTWGGSISYILRHIIRKFSNISAKNNASVSTYKLWYSYEYFVLKSLQTLFVCAYSETLLFSNNLLLSAQKYF